MDMAADRETMERREKEAAVSQRITHLEARLQDAEARIITLERVAQKLAFARAMPVPREWTESEIATWERREEALDAQASGRALPMDLREGRVIREACE